MHVKMPEELLRSPFFTLLDETRLSRERSATETNSGTVFVGHDADSQTLPTGAVEISLDWKRARYQANSLTRG